MVKFRSYADWLARLNMWQVAVGKCVKTMLARIMENASVIAAKRHFMGTSVIMVSCVV